jgi:hypothetical protein
MLRDALKSRRALVTQAITPKGERPPFTEQLSVPDAQRWWSKHRYDDLGKQVLGRMSPQDVLELDQALAQMYEGVENVTER